MTTLKRSFVIAVDGGGTKTRLLIGDTHGHLLADFTGAGSNHQTCGCKQTYMVIRELLERALTKASVSRTEISYAVFGLAGADSAQDHQLLYELLSPLCTGVKYKIVNDAWIILRSGLDSQAGAVCICGTGSNAAAINAYGEQAILRSLDYKLGGYGGGDDIVQQALHYAYRADENTGEKSRLTTELPTLLGVDSMAALVSRLYPEVSINIRERYGQIASLVFLLANQGDGVCQHILINMGTELGKMTSGVIERTGQERLPVDVILGGRVFAGESPLLIDAFRLELHKRVPRANIRLAQLPPVAGAWLMALDELGVEVSTGIISSAFAGD